MLDGKPFTVICRWNMRDEAWYLDLLRPNQTPIANGLKLVLGAIHGARNTDADMPGVFVVRDTSNADREAGLDDIGYDVDGKQQRVLVYFFRFDEVF